MENASSIFVYRLLLHQK
ncbi:Protein of unknown function [Bacillus wiedmannii]|uniref:Uncharacterized protein n=1 Tax=Bacillus wiedmannii TaxID=1890302 RepID=A0AB37YSU9_9BACI|nr:Protein of unknown function [Bacillus wiedmannii]